jgi:hypothetical protein
MSRATDLDRLCEESLTALGMVHRMIQAKEDPVKILVFINNTKVQLETKLEDIRVNG